MGGGGVSLRSTDYTLHTELAYCLSYRFLKNNVVITRIVNVETFMGRALHVILRILVIVINNEPILSSMLAAGIVQDTFPGKTGEGERGRRSGDNWRLLLPPGRKFFPFHSN